MNILVVDDMETILDLIARFLELQDYIVFEANSAEEGIKVLIKEKIDLIVSDYGMADMNGLEFARWVKENKDIPFILLTGTIDTGGLEELPYLNKVLTKPLELTLLVKAIKELRT